MQNHHWNLASRSGAFITSLLFLSAPALAGSILEFNNFIQEGDNGWLGLKEGYGGAFTSDGMYFYTTAVWNNKVAAYERDAGTGLLTQIQVLEANLEGEPTLITATAPVHPEVSADDLNLYVAAWQSDLLFVYARDPITGLLTEIQQIADVASESMGYFTQTSDSEYLIGAGWLGNSLLVYDRDSSDGTVTIVDRVFQADLPVTGLNEPIYPLISPDDRFVYTADYAGNTITIFSFDDSTGQLTYEDIVVDGENGVQDLDGPRWLEFSPDGEYLYCTGLDAHSLVTFDVNTTDGSLTFVDSFVDSIDLNTSRVVTISPDGAMLLSNGYYGNATIQFDRNPVTGLLTRKQTYRNGFAPGAAGFVETRDIVFSPDGANVYVVSWGDEGICTLNVVQEPLAASAVWRLY